MYGTHVAFLFDSSDLEKTPFTFRCISPIFCVVYIGGGWLLVRKLYVIFSGRTRGVYEGFTWQALPGLLPCPHQR